MGAGSGDPEIALRAPLGPGLAGPSESGKSRFRGGPPPEVSLCYQKNIYLNRDPPKTPTKRLWAFYRAALGDFPMIVR